MKLAEALQKLKTLKSKVTRVETYIDSSVMGYEDETLEYVYADEVKARVDLENEIMALKTNIALTNANTAVPFMGSTFSLAGLILLNARLRTEIAFYQKQLKHSLTDTTSYRHVERTKDHVKKVFAAGYDKKTIRVAIDSLEQQKEELDSVIANANQSTDLVGGAPVVAPTPESPA
jgi:hypothetical protein